MISFFQSQMIMCKISQLNLIAQSFPASMRARAHVFSNSFAEKSCSIGAQYWRYWPITSEDMGGIDQSGEGMGVTRAVVDLCDYHENPSRPGLSEYFYSEIVRMK